MKEKMKIMVVALMVTIIGFGLTSMTFQQKPWNVPANYKSKKMPAKVDVAAGKTIYNQSCASCHGKTGKGDGVKAKNLKTPCGDFSSAAYHGKFTDGEIYYQSFIGRDEMPNFEKKVPNEADRWDVVAYIRSLKK